MTSQEDGRTGWSVLCVINGEVQDIDDVFTGERDGG